MRIAHRLCVVMLCVAVTGYASADGNSWGRVRYNGGTLQTKVDPKDWDNHLTITTDTITLLLKDKQQVVIPAKSVTGLSYGQEAHRRVGTMVALGILITPLALFGLMHKTRLHFIGIEYKTEDGKSAGLLLQGDKENYRAILTALEGSTGAQLSVSEKDREFVPGMPNTVVVSEKDKGKGKVPATEAGASAAETGTVSVKSTPEGADVSSDGNFMGNAPASLKLGPGKHTIKVSVAGYNDWTREITVSAGSDLQLNAVLEKQ